MSLKKGDFEKLSEEEKRAYIESFKYRDPQKELAEASFFSQGWPERPSQFIAGLLGLPVERQARVINHPLLIYSLILTFIALKIMIIDKGHVALVENWGFVPSQFYRNYFLTFFTSFFIHASWMHLLGNAYYFYIFGDDVENDMKLSSFLELLFGGHIAGLLLHSFLGASATAPTVGASAGISALMGYYMLRFPKRKITYMLFMFYFWVHVPALLAFMWKFGWEFIVATSSGAGPTNVALWAHIGGALFGAVFALIRKKD